MSATVVALGIGMAIMTGVTAWLAKLQIKHSSCKLGQAEFRVEIDGSTMRHVDAEQKEPHHEESMV